MPQPQIGETRHGASESVRWDGSRWQPVPRDLSAEQGYHPDLADSEHPWLAKIKGFLSGASEAATPGKVGMLAALAVPGVGPAALAGAGATAGLDLLRSHFNTANAPKSGGDFVGDLTESAAPSLLGGAVSKGAGLIDKGLELGSQIPGKIGTIAKVARMATDLVPKALNTHIGTLPWEDAAPAGADILRGSDAFGDVGDRLPRSTEKPYRYDDPAPGDTTPLPQPSVDRFQPNTSGYTGDVPAADMMPRAQPSFDALMPNTSGYTGDVPAADDTPLVQPSVLTGPEQYQHGGDPVSVSRYGPAPEYHSFAPEPSAPAPAVVGKAPALNDTLSEILNGLRGDAAPSSMGDTPSVRSVDRGNMGDLYDQATARQPVTGFDWPEAGGRYEPDDIGSHKLVTDDTPPMSPQNLGIAQAGEFRSGASLPGMEPSEFHIADPGDDAVNALDRSMAAQPAQPSTPATSAPTDDGGMPASLKAIDTLFGPSATDLSGSPFQAESGKNNLLYDPQTPSDYLRQQMQDNSTTDDEREFLGRALRQRLRLGQSASFQGLLPR